MTISTCPHVSLMKHTHYPFDCQGHIAPVDLKNFPSLDICFGQSELSFMHLQCVKIETDLLEYTVQSCHKKLHIGEIYTMVLML